jgi:hypothetical protein
MRSVTTLGMDTWSRGHTDAVMMGGVSEKSKVIILLCGHDFLFSVLNFPFQDFFRADLA